MNELQKKIDVELRRPNAGKDALCNVVADVAQSIADNAGGGGYIIPLLEIQEITNMNNDGDDELAVTFDSDSLEVLDNLSVIDNPDGLTNIFTAFPVRMTMTNLLPLINQSFSESNLDSFTENFSGDVYCLVTNQLAGNTQLQFITVGILNKFILLVRYLMANGSIDNVPEYMKNRYVVMQAIDGK